MKISVHVGAYMSVRGFRMKHNTGWLYLFILIIINFYSLILDVWKAAKDNICENILVKHSTFMELDDIAIY